MNWARDVMSGKDRSAKAAMLRAGTAVVEPAYSGVMWVRNGLYDTGVLKAAKLGRPTISVGNLTTGGTGKTPVVRWLAERLRENGVRPAVLLRGYKVGASVESDEREMLTAALGEGVVVEAGPGRVESAGRVLAKDSNVGAFLLDDGFQHRKVARDFDLVLVNAADPFGFGHVLPRGMLREPLVGLKRADAVVLTRADQGGDLDEIVRTIRRYNADVPIYRASHVHVGLRGDGVKSIEELGRTRFFAFAGIGNPESLERQLAGPGLVGRRWFADHHDYSAGDLKTVGEEAGRAGAEFVVTTEKDWVKVAKVGNVGLPVYRLELEIQFAGDGGERLLAGILDVVRRGGG